MQNDYVGQVQNECVICFGEGREISGYGLGPVICPATSLVHEGYLVCTNCIQKWYRTNSRCIVCNTENRRAVGPGSRIAVIMEGGTDLDSALFTRGGLRILRQVDQEDGVDRGWRGCTGLLVLVAFFAVAMWIMGSMVAPDS